MSVEQASATEPREVWTSNYENNWYTAYVTKYDLHYFIARLEGGDSRYRCFIHRSVVGSDFDSAVIGTKVRLRLTPNRKEGGVTFEALEAIVERD
jgi:hypothetical protein